MITNTTLIVEKEPLGLIEAVSQQLELEDGNQEYELQESCLNQDTVAINMGQDNTQPLVQDTHLQDTDNTAVVVIDTSSL